MAREAISSQERPDLLFEEVELLGGEALYRVRTLGQPRRKVHGKYQHGSGHSRSHSPILLGQGGQFWRQPIRVLGILRSPQWSCLMHDSQRNFLRTYVERSRRKSLCIRM